jgi:hypothetical protein
MTEKCRQITGNFNHHADVVVRCGAHCWRKHIPVFTRVGNWMHTSGECLCHIVPTDAMVDNFGGKHKTQKKNYFFLVANLQSTDCSPSQRRRFQLPRSSWKNSCWRLQSLELRSCDVVSVWGDSWDNTSSSPAKWLSLRVLWQLLENRAIERIVWCKNTSNDIPVMLRIPLEELVSFSSLNN